LLAQPIGPPITRLPAKAMRSAIRAVDARDWTIASPPHLAATQYIAALAAFPGHSAQTAMIARGSTFTMLAERACFAPANSSE
jgi:hypothetical protein